MKLTPSVDFNIILQANFLYKTVLSAFMWWQFGFAFFDENKLSQKLLVKCW